MSHTSFWSSDQAGCCLKRHSPAVPPETPYRLRPPGPRDQIRPGQLGCRTDPSQTVEACHSADQGLGCSGHFLPPLLFLEATGYAWAALAGLTPLWFRQAHDTSAGTTGHSIWACQLMGRSVGGPREAPQRAWTSGELEPPRT